MLIITLRKTKKINIIPLKAPYQITKIYHDNDGIIGYRQMSVFLEREDNYLSKNTIYKYMNKDLGLKSIECVKSRDMSKVMHTTFILIYLTRTSQPNIEKANGA